MEFHWNLKPTSENDFIFNYTLPLVPMAITSGDKKEDRGDDGINEQLCSQRNSWLNGIVLQVNVRIIGSIVNVYAFPSYAH